MSGKIVQAMNGKLVYWVLTLVTAIAGFAVSTILSDIKTDVQTIKAEVSGLDVLENRVQTLEKYHKTGGSN